MSGIFRKIALAAAFVVAFFMIPFTARGADMSGSEREPYKFEFRFGLSGYPLFADLMINGWGCYDGYDLSENHPLEDIVEGTHNGAQYSTGTFTAEFTWICKRWLTLSACIGYNHFWQKNLSNYDNSCIHTDHAGAIYVIPEARFTYLSRRNVKLYSSVGIGATIYHTKTHGHPFSDHESNYPVGVWPSIQLAPIGITVGHKVFGFAELGFGTMCLGGSVGVGYRF